RLAAGAPSRAADRGAGGPDRGAIDRSARGEENERRDQRQQVAAADDHRAEPHRPQTLANGCRASAPVTVRTDEPAGGLGQAARRRGSRSTPSSIRDSSTMLNESRAFSPPRPSE